MADITPINIQVKRHAILSSVGFIVLLPLGVLIARYLRNFTRSWFWGHALIQFLVSGPIIFAGWALGKKTANTFAPTQFQDRHQKIGLALLILYCIQLVFGMLIHVVKVPFIGGHRPPQNYFHAILGLAIIALAFYQVHYGIKTESVLYAVQVPMSALHAWEALIVIFWVLYAAGLAFLPMQYGREGASRRERHEKA